MSMWVFFGGVVVGAALTLAGSMLRRRKGPRPVSADEEAIHALETELGDHLELTRAYHTLALDAFSASPPRPLVDVSVPERIAFNLLTRLCNDLRCVSLLAARGYALQAATLTGSMAEVANTLVYIHDNEERADAWGEHEDPTRPFRPLKAMITDNLTRLGVGEPDLSRMVDANYKVYRQLCWAKHASPVIQTAHGLEFDGEQVRVRAGPETTDAAVRMAWFSLEHAAQFIGLAVAEFAQSFVFDEAKITLRLSELGEDRAALTERAIYRWGNEDPFPGQW